MYSLKYKLDVYQGLCEDDDDLKAQYPEYYDSLT